MVLVLRLGVPHHGHRRPQGHLIGRGQRPGHAGQGRAGDQDRQVMRCVQARDGGLERVPARQRIDLDRAVRGRGADVVQDMPRRHQHAGRDLEARPDRGAVVQDAA
jgi:hypothetical protein